MRPLAHPELDTAASHPPFFGGLVQNARTKMGVRTAVFKSFALRAGTISDSSLALEDFPLTDVYI